MNQFCSGRSLKQGGLEVDIGDIGDLGDHGDHCGDRYSVACSPCPSWAFGARGKLSCWRAEDLGAPNQVSPVD